MHGRRLTRGARQSGGGVNTGLLWNAWMPPGSLRAQYVLLFYSSTSWTMHSLVFIVSFFSAVFAGCRDCVQFRLDSTRQLSVAESLRQRQRSHDGEPRLRNGSGDGRRRDAVLDGAGCSCRRSTRIVPLPIVRKLIRPVANVAFEEVIDCRYVSPQIFFFFLICW